MTSFRSIVLATVAALVAALPASAQKSSLQALSDYLNSLKTVEAEFIQVSDDGSVQTGTLFIQRPGKMRFEYDPPQKSLVLASNNAVAIFDGRATGRPEIYPLRRTPLSLILARNVNLGAANMVVGHSFDGKHTIVTAQDPKEPETGQLQMKFLGDPIILQEWVIQDATGAQTTIRLKDVETGMSFPRSLFNIDTEVGKRSR
ncbi:LolA family protein [Shimia marina]|uniref:Outer-membrane lipoprotein carrier protein n=1 Tax=Shimia marina TaxID=321267 RepID=A0A0P1EKH7_9RHOB|nr:outer membrane lipoprotein carrier protein LolA [Shimia marina]CUH51029.1 Outer-membrane lipoprotein carrier protein precursor [Shimia marina]SFD59953.1 Outer membrane lipoprotein-sorting protein [Shimia marina]